MSIAYVSSWLRKSPGATTRWFVSDVDKIVTIKFEPSVDGGDGRCEPVSEGSEECQPDAENPCVFKGWVVVTYRQQPPGVRLDVVATTAGGAAVAETKHAFGVFKGEPKSDLTLRVPIGTAVGGPNTSDCEGLVNPIEASTNGYIIRVYAELPTNIDRTHGPIPRDDNGMPIDAPPRTGFYDALAYLYCEPCYNIVEQAADAQNPHMVYTYEMEKLDQEEEPI